ncbi:MAG: hypothetical protein GF392_06415 [Candidatus Omnitrophica bacterium]|nr:hypothetical protein [Candidatus Omnitrophota bacterium]
MPCRDDGFRPVQVGRHGHETVQGRFTEIRTSTRTWESFYTMRRTVYGQSMLPLLRHLDVCITAEHDPYSIRPGDIVVYRSGAAPGLSVHRVIAVDISGGTVSVKGDNVPLSGVEELPVGDVKEKVVSVERDARSLDLGTPLQRARARALASLSKADLTPTLARKRFLEPLLLWALEIPIVMTLTLSAAGGYKDLKFGTCRLSGSRGIRLLALLGRRWCARADMELGDSGEVLANAYVRYRHRNDPFFTVFLEEIKKMSQATFGPGRTISVLSREISRWHEKVPDRQLFERFNFFEGI